MPTQRRGAALGAAVVGIALACMATAQVVGETLALRLRSNVVRVVARSAETETYGFGFIVGLRGDRLLVVTADHVVRSEGTPPAEIDVVFYTRDCATEQCQGLTERATLLPARSAKPHDLAVLEVHAPADLPWTPSALALPWQVKRGEEVWFIGRTGTWYVPSTPGRVNAVTAESILHVDGLSGVQPGTSGGPLIGRGGIVGMIVRDDLGVVHAVSIEFILQKMVTSGYAWSLRFAGIRGGPLVRVAAGPFLMGSNDLRGPRFPPRQIHLDEFLIDKYEVTVEDFRRFAADTGVRFARGCNWSLPERGRHPMNCVTWQEAEGYCRWAGKWLPTEAEWEKAARGPHGHPYPWGDDPIRPDFAALGRESSAEVGSHPRDASPYGAMDMLGNVTEWVADWYDPGYPQRAPERNPPGPERGEDRVLRGGSYVNRPQDASLLLRRRNLPTAGPHYADYGFRCVVRSR